jgi:aryl-alcohol dehydrogenase-like predicted oxidoreductase
MKYRQLGRSGLKVSELCLGTMNFGPRTPEAESFHILSRACEAGINFVDTANQYGGSLGVGATELIIGRWLAQDASRRDRLVLATKVHEPMSDDVNDRGLSSRHIQMACDASLQRLGVEHIDLYQMHHIDRATPIDEIWMAMERLIAQGQSLYNLIERRVELEVLPACREYGLGLIPWSPLAGGLLAGAGSGADGRRQSEGMQQAIAARADQLGSFQGLCAQLDESPSSVALAWLLHQPGVAATIIGPGSIEQLESVLHVPEIVLSAQTLAQLDEIFPACGPAPEAYAW